MSKLKKLKKDTARKRRYLKHFKKVGSKKAMTYGEWVKKGEKGVYFKGVKKPTVESRLREAGLSEKELRTLGGGRLYKKKKR